MLVKPLLPSYPPIAYIASSPDITSPHDLVIDGKGISFNPDVGDHVYPIIDRITLSSQPHAVPDPKQGSMGTVDHTSISGL